MTSCVEELLLEGCSVRNLFYLLHDKTEPLLCLLDKHSQRQSLSKASRYVSSLFEIDSSGPTVTDVYRFF